MTTPKGKKDFAKRNSGHSRFDTARLISTLSCLPVVFTACIHWPDIATDCEAYGVSENHQPLGSVVVTEPLYREQLTTVCGQAGHAVALINPDARISGCVIPQEHGIVYAYYWVGDQCAMNHELCHAVHGAEHTDRYLRDLSDGVPMPYCPPNQLNTPANRG